MWARDPLRHHSSFSSDALSTGVPAAPSPTIIPVCEWREKRKRDESVEKIKKRIERSQLSD